MTALTSAQKALVADAMQEFGPLAHAMARRLRGVTPDDLLGAVHAELVSASRRYDPSKNVRFNGYAYPGVVGAMLDAAARERKSATFKRLAAAARRVSVLPGDDDDDDDIIDIPGPNDPGPETTVPRAVGGRAWDIVAAFAADEPSTGGEDEVHEKLETQRLLEIVREGIRDLEADEQRLVVMLYEEHRTADDAARELGVTDRTIRRMHAAVREKLLARMRRMARARGSSHTGSPAPAL